MSRGRSMSKAAEAMKSPALGWGVALVGLAGFAWFGFAVGDGVPVEAAWSPLMLLIPGLGLVAFGLWKDQVARRFNREDSARADRLEAALAQLCRTQPEAAYAKDDYISHVASGRLVEMERHFDSVTAGQVIGSLQHQLGFFGRTFTTGAGYGCGAAASSNSWGRMTGQSSVALKISATTRDNLLGDALFAVVEVGDRNDDFDTVRVLGLAEPAVKSWIVDLTHRAADQVGGPRTHSGRAVAAWSTRLADMFGNTQVSYASDQLAAVSRRPDQERPLIGLEGVAVGHNAVLASMLSVGNRSVRLFPHRLPSMLGAAMTNAVGQAVAPTAPAALPH